MAKQSPDSSASSPQSTDREIGALKREIAALQAELTATQAVLAEKDAHLQRILSTVGWRLLSKYGRFKYGVLKPALAAVRRRGGANAPRIEANASPSVQGSARREVSYADWAAANERIRFDPDRAARRVRALSATPTVSVITPVYDTPANVLEAAIRSVREQLYPHWELCLYDDASPSAHVRQTLERHAAEDPRIRIAFGKGNVGISGALNGALALATGDLVAFLDHDDAITPDALLEMVSAIDESGADIAYSDEDKYDTRGNRHDPFFKPDWSPDLFLWIMYTCHLTVMRRDIVDRAGGFRSGFEGSQDYDLWLRATELTDSIAHVPMVLYHWRQIAGSTAVDVSNKGYAHERSRRAIAEALERRGVAATVGDGPVPTSFHVVRHVVDEPLVSIVIPTRNRVDLLANAIDGIEKRTDYRNVEIIVVDNGSTDEPTLEYLSTTSHRVIRDDGAFNFSRLNNLAAADARGEHLLLLNNDTEPLASGWLRAMVEHAQRPEVGVVGAKLLYPSGRVQHAGVILGIGGVAGHSHKHFSKDAPGYFQALHLLRDFSAVTAACALDAGRSSRRSAVSTSATWPSRSTTWISACVFASAAISWCGRRTPFSTHFESESRGFDLDAREIDYMITRWGDDLFRDPYLQSESHARTRGLLARYHSAGRLSIDDGSETVGRPADLVRARSHRAHLVPVDARSSGRIGLRGRGRAASRRRGDGATVLDRRARRARAREGARSVRSAVHHYPVGRPVRAVRRAARILEIGVRNRIGDVLADPVRRGGLPAPVSAALSLRTTSKNGAAWLWYPSLAWASDMGGVSMRASILALAAACVVAIGNELSAGAEEPVASDFYSFYQQVRIVGDRAYVAASAGLVIYDISDAAHPREVSHLLLDRSGSFKVEVSGNTAFVLSGAVVLEKSVLQPSTSRIERLPASSASIPISRTHTFRD